MLSTRSQRQTTAPNRQNRECSYECGNMPQDALSTGTKGSKAAHTQREKGPVAALKTPEEVSRAQNPAGSPTTLSTKGLSGSHTQQDTAGSCHSTLHFWDA